MAFNILQRREVLHVTHSRVQYGDFISVGHYFDSIASEKIEAVAKQMSINDFTTAYTEGE